MLSNILAILVAFGSFLLYMAAFFFPEVHRKGDFFWSGIGMFYALVLWFCAGRITGAVLLGQTATVAFMGWFAWQTLLLRREVTPTVLRTEVSDKVVAKSGGFGLFKGKPKDKPVSVAPAPPTMENLPSLEDVLVPQKPESISPPTVIQVPDVPVVLEDAMASAEEILANIEVPPALMDVVSVVEELPAVIEEMLVVGDDVGLDVVEPAQPVVEPVVEKVETKKVETKKEPVKTKKKDKKDKKEKEKAKAGGFDVGKIFAPLAGLFAKKKDKNVTEVKPVVGEKLPVMDVVFEDVEVSEVPVVESVTVENDLVVEATEGAVPDLVRPNEPSAELVEAAQVTGEMPVLAEVVVAEIAPEVDLAPPAEASVEAPVEVGVEAEPGPVSDESAVLVVEALAEGEPVVVDDGPVVSPAASEGGFAELLRKENEVPARVEVAKRSASAQALRTAEVGPVKEDVLDDDDDDF